MVPLSSPDRREHPRRRDDRRLEQRERQLLAARQISEALFQRITTDELVRKALETAVDVVGAECGSILLADPETKQLIFKQSIGSCPVPVGTGMPWNEGIAGHVFQSGTSAIIEDVKLDARHYKDIDHLTKHVTRDMIAIPLKRWEGEPIGVLEVINKRDGKLGEDEVAILTIVSALAATSIEQAKFFNEAKLAEVARLLGDIGHDIKNMLVPVLRGSEVLETEIEKMHDLSSNISPEQAKTSLHMCNQAIKSVLCSTRRIQDRVKEIAECVKGLCTPLQLAPCTLSMVVEAVFETLNWAAKQGRVSLNCVGLEQLPPIVADENRLFNAFYNLVNNAIPEVPPGGHVTISGREDPTRKTIVVTVSDSGRGMPREIQENLFTPRVKSFKKGGTGLGTKIVKDVIDAHGGHITVESEEGVGTKFVLSLPLRPPLCHATG